MNYEAMKAYAKIIVEMGVNVQEGQSVVVTTSTKCDELAELVVEECYAKGASDVRMNWVNNKIQKLKFMNESLEELSKFSDEEKAKYEAWVKKPPVKIYIDDDDPDAFKGVAIEKLVEPKKARYPFMKPYIDAMNGKAQWTIVAMPSLPWARKMYPNLSDEDAMASLEKAIMHTMRMDQGDALENWHQHIDTLCEKAQKMNALNLEELHYTASNGTDLNIKLHPNHIWCTAYEKQENGISSCVNMPSEEVFTHPDLKGVNGIVYSSKPLSYNGNLIENFSVEFKDGKAIHVTAEKGLEHLQEMIKMDEGASYLGEVALVPYDSPINQIGTLFYNTLFDENASCHLALGDGIGEAIKGYEGKTKDELIQMGCNDSMIHVDFMVGTKDLDIVGITKDHKEIKIFKDGLWAI